jgi:hypothetical protein
MSVRDAINHALQDNPSELKNSIYSALDAKVADALELKKISTASEYFNIPEEEEYTPDDEEETIDEISLKTKVNAFRKMKHSARKQHDPGGREGHSYDSYDGENSKDPKKREKGVATDKDPATKALHRRAHKFLGKIKKGHGSKAADQAKGGSDKDAKKYPYDKHGKDYSTSTSAQVDKLYTRTPAKIMKGGPRKGKMSKDAIETSKRIARQRVGEEKAPKN